MTTTSMPFVHLHCHSHYSLLDGANRIPELVARVKELGMNAIALTDHGNLYGAIELYRECTAAGIKPIIGYEAYVAPGRRQDRDTKGMSEASYHLTLMAKNYTGVQNLIKMASYAYLDGFYYKPRIDKQLLKEHSEGLICLSGCLASEFMQHLIKDEVSQATKLAHWYRDLFRDDFYIEIQRNGIDLQDQCNVKAIDIAKQMGVPLVATCDAHYLCSGDDQAHDVLLCINTGKLRSDTNRMRYAVNQFYVRSPQEMEKLWPDFPDAVRQSQQIADKVDIKIDFKKRHFPVFNPPDGKTAEQYLRELCDLGMKERYGDKPSQAVKDRLEHELKVIFKLGFASYFLIVWDFVRFANEKQIPCGARGSACGAVVSYVLKLSHVDPLEYDLLFERFLDPNRAEAPDIDIDFCQDRREEVIQYVREKYGEQSVAQIATFGTMAARAAIKDVGRVLGIELDRVTQLTKFIPEKLGITLDEALEQSVDLRQAYETDPRVHELLDIARKLEGTNRNVGTHAAGVVIANGPITNYVPVQRVTQKNDTEAGQTAVITTQWTMDDLDKVGMLKMDFLGLRTLTLLDKALRLIKQRRGIEIDVQKLPLDDKPTYELLQSGKTQGVFQFESDGIRNLLRQMKPDNIRDIIASTALYRPGPLQGGMVDAYINCKHGKEKPEYAHPIMEEILTETYGVMCIHEDARVSMADGEEKPIKHVRRGDRVHSLNYDTGRFEIKECHGCGPTRRSDGVKVVLENGFSVTLTPDHKVWTYDGWKEAGDLDPEKDIVGVGLHLAQEAPSFAGFAPWLGEDEDVAYLMGMLIGDGCLTSSGITIATGKQDNHDRFMQWLRTHLPKLNVHEHFHLRSWYVDLSCPDLLNDPAFGNRKTKLHHFLEQYGLKKKACDKRVPLAIFRSPTPVRAAFLAGLFDADGCLTQTRQGVAVSFLASVSEGLLQDVRRLCQMEGLAVSVKLKHKLYVWNQKDFKTLVEPYLVIKKFVGKLNRGLTYGWLPRKRLFAAVPTHESERAFSRRTGIERRSMHYSHPLIKASTARKAGIDLGDVRYLRIHALEKVTDQQFYGMSVADHHNLVANGIVVKNCYQEQVMRILNRLGGIELSSAYACIKAISKKKMEIIDQRRGEFIKGAIERGVLEDVAKDIFEKIVFFGGYGFNKSHSTAYAYVSYQTGFLKAHYPAEFAAAVLTSEMGNTDKIIEHIKNAKEMGLEILPPDVNASDAEFSVASDTQVRFGLGAIKGFGRKAAQHIAGEREAKGPYKDLFDLCERIDQKVVSRAAMETLVKAGALDCLGNGHRAALMLALPGALQAAQQVQEDRRRGQRHIFDMLEEEGADKTVSPADRQLPAVSAWDKREQLAFEKEVLGFYMSSHPLAEQADVLRRFSTHTLQQLNTLPAQMEVVVGGIIAGLRYTNAKRSRNGDTRMARFKFEDMNGNVECVLFPDDFQRCKDLLKDDLVCFLKGTVDKTREDAGLIVTRILLLDQVKREQTRGIMLRLFSQSHAEQIIPRIGDILQRARGRCPVYLEVTDQKGRRARLRVHERFFVEPNTLPVGDLELLLGGAGHIEYMGAASAAALSTNGNGAH